MTHDSRVHAMALVRLHHAVVRPPVRLGLVGCGRLAERGYLPAFRQAGGVELVAVADANRTRCIEIAPRVPAYENMRALVDAGGIEAVVIATPTRSHVADARLAAERGLPALVEKPPGIDSTEAAALASLHPAPWMGFNRRFDSGIAQLREGLPPEAEIDLRLELHYRRKAWNSFDMRDDALLDLGPHLIDLARWLTDTAIRQVRTLSLHPHQAVFQLELERGRAIIACSNNRPHTEQVKVKDARGRVVARHKRGGVVVG